MIINENRLSQLLGAPRLGQTLLGASAYSISILLHDLEHNPGELTHKRKMLLSISGGWYDTFEVHVCLPHRAGGKRRVNKPCCAKFG